MQTQRNYATFMLSDEPRILGIPLVIGLPCVAFTLLGLLFGYGYQGFLLGAGLSLLLHLKFNGQGLRLILAVMYWLLPEQLSKTCLGLRRSPASHQRVYL
jgi:conjugal transfer pilus assembly protein TraL